MKKGSVYIIEYNNDLDFLETSAKTLPQLESDIRSKINFEEDTKLVLEFRKNEQLFILDDIKNLEDGMTIKISSVSQKLTRTKEKQLLSACEKGSIEEVIQLLHEQDLDPNCGDPENYGRTPLYLACKNGHIEIVKQLLNDTRVDINKANGYGQTPLFLACQEGHIDIVKLLLNDKRIDINKSTNNGSTPFYIACRKGHTEIVNVLRNESNHSFILSIFFFQ